MKWEENQLSWLSWAFFSSTCCWVLTRCLHLCHFKLTLLLESIFSYHVILLGTQVVRNIWCRCRRGCKWEYNHHVRHCRGNAGESYSLLSEIPFQISRNHWCYVCTWLRHLQSCWLIGTIGLTTCLGPASATGIHRDPPASSFRPAQTLYGSGPWDGLRSSCYCRACLWPYTSNQKTVRSPPTAEAPAGATTQRLRDEGEKQIRPCLPWPSATCWLFFILLASSATWGRMTKWLCHLDMAEILQMSRNDCKVMPASNDWQILTNSIQQQKCDYAIAIIWHWS